MPRLNALVAAAVLTAAPFTTALAAPSAVEDLERVAVVELQRCLLETGEGKRAKAKLEKTFAKGQARLDKKAAALQKKFIDLQAKAAMLSEEELMKRQQELAAADQELQQLGYELQQDVTEKEQMLSEKIYEKVAKIVEQIALEEGIQIVLVKSEMTVLYANPKLDLTNRVIVRYDKAHK